MSRILINAVSAKNGGARTIIESFVAAAAVFPQYEFIVLSGFKSDQILPCNVRWYYRPKSGVAAMVYSLFGVVISYLRYRADYLISFNNINTRLVPANKRVTYFHQLKALDPFFSEPKLWVIRWYLRHTKEPVILQSQSVRSAFESMFGVGQREIIVSWPGVVVPSAKGSVVRCPKRILVPIASPESQHKNFDFILAVAKCLGNKWHIIVTAPDGIVDLEPAVANISFVGVLSRNELFEEYRRATVCLLSSTHETVGLPVFEALAVNTHVVAYNAPYIHAFCESFGISEGLILVNTPMEAAARIDGLSQIADTTVVSTHDFCKGDWIKTMSVLLEKQ